MSVRRGFTLVELMIVMAITGIIASQLVGMLDDARAEAWRRATPLQWAARANVAFSRIGRDVQAAATVTPGEDLQVDAIRWRLADGKLLRDAEVIAAPVSAARFAREGDALVITLEFAAERGRQRANARHATRIALREDLR